MMTVKFDVSSDDRALIEKIVDRVEREFPDDQVDRLSMTMDITSVHANHPLKLQDWLKAESFDFRHDVVGIVQHLDRETGELRDDFRPRFAEPTGEVYLGVDDDGVCRWIDDRRGLHDDKPLEVLNHSTRGRP